MSMFLFQRQLVLGSTGQTGTCWHRQPIYICPVARNGQAVERLMRCVVAAPAILGER